MSSVLNHARSFSGIPRLRACLLNRIGLDKQNPYTTRPRIYFPRSGFSFGLNRSNLRSFKSTVLLKVLASPSIDTASPIKNQKTNETSTQGSTGGRSATISQISAKTSGADRKAKLRQTKLRVKPKPAEYLSKALRNGGHALGYSGQLIELDRAHSKRGHKNQIESRTVGRPKKPSLPVILGEYIREVDPLLSHAVSTHTGKDLDAALENVFRDNNHEYLTSRQYAPTDVTAWAWIMKSRGPHEAAVRLFSFEINKAKSGSKSPSIPPFITLHLLRHHNMDAHTFRLLLIHSLHLMSGQPFPKNNHSVELHQDDTQLLPVDSHTGLDSGTCMILVVRLIRHARRVWPQALLTIARAFAHFLTTPRAKETGRSALGARQDDRVKTDKFNECLWLLSLPASISPYRSTYIQQQAQFELLRAMATHKPVLPVTRQGYRAIVAVQLAHKKTNEERQSAELKAPSWPPWKEEKLGIDSLRGNEGMYSRAMQVLSQMKDAGYSHRLWENVSSILAGWDTDHSPTVQTRSIMRRPQSLPDKHAPKRNHHEIWVARIRSTRTVREAWACFLSYQDQGLPAKGAVYAAMAEKLIYRRNAIERNFSHVAHALPGDGPEVYPEPASARDIIYVSTEPPSLDDFLDQMLSQGLRPSGRFLSLLLQSATSMRSGLHYLRCSGLTDAQVAALSTVKTESRKYNSIEMDAFQAVPDLVFASFIKFLCAHSNIISSEVGSRNILTADRFPALIAQGRTSGPNVNLLTYFEENSSETHYPRALWHAIQLTKLRRIPYPPAWKHILSSLARDRLTGVHGSRGRSLLRILAWHQTLKALTWMRQRDVELGDEGFQTLCVAFTKATDGAFKHPGTAEQSFTLLHHARIRRLKAKDGGHDDFEAFLQHALCVLKDQFDRLVLPASKTSEHAERSIFASDDVSDAQLRLPLMLHTPSPATIHAFVRALGSIGDDDGLLHLLHWMSRSADLLKEAADEHSNGDKMMHRVLVAIRVFLERRQQRAVDRVPSDLVHEAYDLVRRTGWDWPSDLDVEEYCRV